MFETRRIGPDADGLRGAVAAGIPLASRVVIPSLWRFRENMCCRTMDRNTGGGIVRPLRKPCILPLAPPSRSSVVNSAHLDAVHVWAVPCTDPPVAIDRLAEVLSDEERRRAQRFRFEADRVRAVVGRGMLRTILAEFLETPPAALAIAAGAHGKPVLAGRAGPDFNVSHSGDWVMIGLARDAAIGVDVEQERTLSDLDALAERFFAPGEVEVIRSLPQEQRTRAFFRCWTRKEAYLKAIGAGISGALDSFEVEFRPDLPAALRTLGGSREAAARWRLWSASPARGYAAAVATIAQVPIRSWRWSHSGGVVPWEP
jgi:4'-phosphopantetheinyl transferase